jgi:RHS repeat-associated protein
MVFDQTGALANVKRHDYLPFGEELYADTGGRTTGQGNTASGNLPADGARQKFTSYERDNETTLDYAQARYYSSTQGRFTSVDPLMASGRLSDPQSWNRYVYVLNKPTKLTDPYGLEPQDPLPTLTGCNPRVQSGCSELGSLGITVTVIATPEPITTTDTQALSQLQLMTGQANPLPQDGATVQMLDAIAAGQANGVLAGAAVGTLGSAGANVPTGLAVATGAVLGVAAYDLIGEIANAISRQFLGLLHLILEFHFTGE